MLTRPTRSRHVHVDERVTRDSHPPLQGTLPDQQVGLAQAPIKRLLLPRDFMCAFKSEVSVSLSPVRSCNEAPLAFKAKCSGSSPSRCWTPGLGSLTWGSELSLLWENFCNVITLQCVCRPPGGQGMGFDYFASLLLLPSHCGSFFMLEKVFSGRFQSFSLMVFCRCYFDVLVRGGELSVFLCHLGCSRGCGEKGTLLPCWWEHKLVQPLWKIIWSSLKKLKIELPYDPAIPLLDIYPKKMKTLI